MSHQASITPYILFSDTVIREEGSGKLSIIGSFQNFNVSRFPFMAPPFVVTVCFGNLRGRIDKIRLSVRIEHSGTGEALMSVSTEMRLRGEISPSHSFEIPIRILPCKFPEAGSYSVVVLIDDEIIGLRPLIIRAIEPPLSTVESGIETE